MGIKVCLEHRKKKNKGKKDHVVLYIGIALNHFIRGKYPRLETCCVAESISRAYWGSRSIAMMESVDLVKAVMDGCKDVAREHLASRNLPADNVSGQSQAYRLQISLTALQVATPALKRPNCFIDCQRTRNPRNFCFCINYYISSN